MIVSQKLCAPRNGHIIRATMHPCHQVTWRPCCRVTLCATVTQFGYCATYCATVTQLFHDAIWWSTEPPVSQKNSPGAPTSHLVFHHGIWRSFVPPSTPLCNLVIHQVIMCFNVPPYLMRNVTLSHWLETSFILLFHFAPSNCNYYCIVSR